MKAIIITIIIINISIYQKANAVCEAFITNEWPNYRYTVEDISGDKIVTDNKTGLMWKQCSEGLSGSDCMTGTTTAYRWDQALAIPDTLNLTGFAGFSDWRVPNIEELQSIAAHNCFLPAINETAFPNTPFEPSGEFWSSSPFAVSTYFAWYYNFGYGRSSYNTRFGVYYVRLVRSGQ